MFKSFLRSSIQRLINRLIERLLPKPQPRPFHVVQITPAQKSVIATRPTPDSANQALIHAIESYRANGFEVVQRRRLYAHLRKYAPDLDIFLDMDLVVEYGLPDVRLN